MSPANHFWYHQKQGLQFIFPAPAAPLLPEKVVSMPGREAGRAWLHHKRLQELAHASNEWYHNFVTDLHFCKSQFTSRRKCIIFKQVKFPQDLWTIHIPSKSTGVNAHSIYGKPTCPFPHENVGMRTEKIRASSAFSVHTGLVYC